MTRLTDDQIREVIARLTSGTDKAKRALAEQALAGDASARFALAFWAKRMGVV